MKPTKNTNEQNLIIVACNSSAGLVFRNGFENNFYDSPSGNPCLALFLFESTLIRRLNKIANGFTVTYGKINQADILFSPANGTNAYTQRAYQFLLNQFHQVLDIYHEKRQGPRKQPRLKNEFLRLDSTAKILCLDPFP
jgi:hypothetical protein